MGRCRRSLLTDSSQTLERSLSRQRGNGLDAVMASWVNGAKSWDGIKGTSSTARYIKHVEAGGQLAERHHDG